MPYLRARYLQENIAKVATFSPLIGLLGHRQVGKTTLLEQVSNEYLTLDDQDTMSLIAGNPKQFLAGHHSNKTAIDESQLLPALFPALKERVRKNKKPGQFILSGSVRFTSRKAIRESLTGRIINLELLPMTISEIKQLPCPTILKKMLDSNLEQMASQVETESAMRKTVREQIEPYLERGGLPGVCFMRNEQLRTGKIKEQLLTILDRDLRMVFPTTLPYSQILLYVQELAKNECAPLNYSLLRKTTGISEVTQKKLIYALEAVFILRTLPIQGDKKGFICFFEDQGEQRYLSQETLDEARAFEGLCYRNARAQFFYDDINSYSYSHFLTRGHSRIPFVVHSSNAILGFMPILEDLPTRSHLAQAGSLLKHYANAKIIFITKNGKFNLIDHRQLVIPAHII